jgi:hypothetical protein
MQNDVEVREVESTKTKRKFKVFLNGRGTNFVAKEIFEDGKVKWYPFYRSRREILPRYKNIKYVQTSNKLVPKAGFSMSGTRGYGFTNAQGVDKFFKFVDKELPKLKGVAFVEDKSNFKSSGVLEIAYKDFGKIRREAKLFHDAKKSEETTLISNTLHAILPATFKAAGKYIYTEGSLKRFLDRFSEDHFSFSEEEAERMRAILLGTGLSTETVLATKRQIDKVYIEDVLSEFKRLYALPKSTSNLEEKWHQFFKKHSWIFSQVFAFPATFLDEKFNVGGHDITGSTDKIVDFIYQNKLTKNITFIEIKTHQTKIINDSAYRKPDIFSVSKDVSGAIVQVLDQQLEFLKKYYQLKGNSAINSLNSTCLLIVGDFASLSSEEKKNSFELFRLSNKDVVIITFDEVLEKISTLLEIFTKDQEAEQQ